MKFKCAPVIGLGILMAANPAFSADSWTSSKTISAVTTYADGFVMFNVQGSLPTNTCSYFGSAFKFDANTNGGKILLSTLLAAAASGRTINISYTNSGAPSGSTDTSGCTKENMAVAWAITFIGM